MIKFYEVAPEYKERPIEDCDFNEGCCYGEVTVTGNRDYGSYKSKVFETASEIFDLMYCHCITSVPEAKERFDIADEAALKAAFSGNYEQQTMCDLMQALTGREFGWTTIHGCCQGDWQYMYYPKDMWTKEALDWFETAYWNLGREWVVEDEDSRISLYSCEWRDSEMKRDLAEQYGVPLEECEFYEFSGWVKKPSYKQI